MMRFHLFIAQYSRYIHGWTRKILSIRLQHISEGMNGGRSRFQGKKEYIRIHCILCPPSVFILALTNFLYFLADFWKIYSS